MISEERFLTAGGDSFHPHQREGSGAPVGRAERRRRLRRTPGQLPWRTFCQGSLFIISVWAMGFFWCLFRLFYPQIDLPVPSAALGLQRRMEGSSEDGLPRLIFAGPWPHAYFQPLGLACAGLGDAGAGSEGILVSSRFGVHRPGTKAESWEPVLAECLARDPEFHAGGLQGLARVCLPAEEGRPSRCGTALLGSNGTSALLCADDEAGGGVAEGAIRLHLHGGPWRSILSLGEGGAEGRLGAIREQDGALVWLQWSGRQDLMPQFEQRLKAGLQRAAFLSSSSVFLGLQEESLLKSWNAALGTGAAPLWALHLPMSLRWRELCVAREEHAAYLVAWSKQAPVGRMADRMTETSLWRLPLPAQLFNA